MSLVERLEAGETLVTGWSGVPDPLTVEIMAAQPFDVLTLDMQHGGHNEDSVLRCLPAVLKSGKPAIVRIPVGRFDMASRALDFGAEAVIAPMINSVEDARRFASFMKYPPVGERSWGPTYGFPRHGKGDHAAWLAESNRRTMAFAMVETRAALAALDGILETPGIDAIFLGPADFSIAWTNGATVNGALDDMMGAVEDIARRARAAGKHCAIYIVEPKIAARLVGMGYRLLAYGSEHQLMARGAESMLRAVRDELG